jgi:SAM-dependent methyltransferase
VARKSAEKSGDFAGIVATLTDTKSGQEASMYPRLAELFMQILGYARKQVLSDTAGDAGRPDITVRAPSGLIGPNGNPHEIDWIVVEAKDARTHLENQDTREALFAEKSKYVTPNTAWFVMVTPVLFIARPVMNGTNDISNDIEFSFLAEDEAAFRHKFAALHADMAGVPERLRRFREGDTSQIAAEKLIAPAGAAKRVVNRVQVARRAFYTTLRETTGLLQQATLQTLRSVQPQVDAIAAEVAVFEKEYGPYEFDAYGLTVTANPRLEQRRYGADVAKLNRRLRKAGSLSRLAIVGWPSFSARVAIKEKTPEQTKAKMQEMFAIETANLILARTLLIRFFEDHGFFGEHRYLCNGGVAAFQQLRQVFEAGYTRLLKMAYEKAQSLYAAAFDETELDWVFDAHDERLSGAIEWAMYQLSRYDFKTVKGDILTGVYDRFLDRDQRKRFGEYYTPPSIARYIIDRLDLKPGDRFLDPACGSGTFLIERYQQAVGEDADRGLASFDEVVRGVEALAGNDLNTFSAVLAQIQLLWHILQFREELLAADDFPDIAISDKASSIVAAEATDATHGRWVELDRIAYAGIGGNPPYVRPERGGELSDATKHHFEMPREHVAGGKSWPGISAEANLYALFIYRALNDWCRQPNKWGEGAGRLGFVVPLALCGTRENAALRKLFAPGGRWTIREIVDLEVIWRQVFDADVLPMILIAEARPPRLPLLPELLDKATPLPTDPVLRHQVRAARLQPWLEERAKRNPALAPLVQRNRKRWEADEVTVRLADKSVIDFHEGGKRPSFRIEDAEAATAAYADIFTPDGRIMTRLTPERRAIIEKLLANAPFPFACQTYWQKKKGEGRGAVQLEAPDREQEKWEQRDMIARGLVWRGTRKQAAPGEGLPVYKAENIISGSLVGEAQDANADIAQASDLGLFRLSPILPQKIWGVAMIATCPNAVSFDPSELAFTDTATLFAPRADLSHVRFDLIFVSRVYRYAFALSGRMSYLNLMRSHVYPANLRLLPWNEDLAVVSGPLEALRPAFVEACANHFQTAERMFAALAALPLKSFKEVVKNAGGKVEWSESFQQSAEKIEIGTAPQLHMGDEGWRLQVSGYLYDWLLVSDEDAAKGLLAALKARSGESVDQKTLLDMPIAPDAATRADYLATVEMYGGTDHMAAIEAQVDRIDALVGPALGLDANDLAAIRHDMLTDPFLKYIVPRWPGSSTRLHGYRTGLDSSERYA